MLYWWEWLIAVLIGIVAFFVILRLLIGVTNLIDDLSIKNRTKTKRK